MSATIAEPGPSRARGPNPLQAGQLATLGLLIALAAVAWLLTDSRMAGMDAGPGTDPGTFGFYITTWVVMMAAMMFPSIAPMVLMHRNLQAGRRARGHEAPAGTTALFVAGYLAIWGASGLLAYVALKLGRSVDGGLLAWHRGGRWAAAGLLLAAAAYELTPVKAACLTRCRSPLAFLIGSWREGRVGALSIGIKHGAWCLGCCWLLMVGLFALGAMSITWMILIAVLIAAEKLLPWRGVGRFGVAAVLAALALGVAATPQNVPALTIPGSPSAMRAMNAMDGSGAGKGGSMKVGSMKGGSMKGGSMGSSTRMGK
jgi:predicted metal-binding membrane protein